ncbi:helix-turn-helix domain-containing protein [Methanobrevibacter sp. UBA313]|jgi:AraC-like DNA-binding protein|uniref:helix-turn-helix domain-containing protein n=1 Tax=Methanobrevibacter sp. UBA313 TaxID=1915477 RepID=UPI0039B8745F
MIARSQDITTLCNGKKIIMKKGCIMPFNSFDSHGQDSSITIDSFICIILPSNIIKKIAADVFGFKEQPIFENKSFSPSSSLNYYLGVFIDECDNGEKANKYYQNLLKELIIIELFKCSKNNVLTYNEKSTSSILRAKKYLDENYKVPFNLQKVSDISGLNKYYFIKKFKEELKVSPYNYLLHLKIEKAKNMIIQERKTLTEISFELGFSTQSHFISQFKKIVGITPGEFKKIIIK